MGRYFLTNKAVQDLSAIWNYTVEKWSEQQADAYYVLLLEACKDLALGLSKGKNYTNINPEIFGYRVGQHIFFYRSLKKGNPLEIIRILHTQMDLKNRMKD